MLVAGAAARAQYWQVDASFAPILESSQADGGSIAAYPLPDGTVLLSSSYSYINGTPFQTWSHLNADGSLAAPFTPAVAIQGMFQVTSAGILAYGSQSGGPTLYRLTETGAIDSSFSAAAITNLSMVPAQARIQANGQIILSGSNATHLDSALLIRLNADGSLDSTFQPAIDANGSNLADIEIDANGKIIVAGVFSLPGFSVSVLVARLNPDGSLDSSFTPLTATDLPGTFSVRWTSPQPNGGILFLGNAALTLQWLLPSGQLDASFHSGLPNLVQAIGQPVSDGKIYFSYGSSQVSMGRLNADGSIDSTFAYGPITAGAYASFGGLPVTWDDNTLYLASPLTAARDSAREDLSQLNAAGVLNASFAPRFSQCGGLSAFVHLGSGQYLIAGQFDYCNGTVLANPGGNNIIRLNSDGSLDASFPIALASGQSVSAIYPQPGGAIVIAGWFPQGQVSGVTSQRYNADGSVDSTFAAPANANFFAADSSGNLYCEAGSGLERLLPNGTVDGSFASTATPQMVAVAANGKIFVFPNATQSPLMRLNSDGSTDTSFNSTVIPMATGIGLAALPDGTALTVMATSTPGLMQVTHYSNSGAADAVYDQVYYSDTSPFAGIVLDQLLADGGTEATLVFSNGSRDSFTVDVGSNGQAMEVGPVFQRLLRTSLTSPSLSLVPTIFAPPTNQTGAVGQSVTLTVVPTGIEPYTFQWYQNGVAVPGATNPVLTLQNLQASSAGSYSVTVADSAGSVTSSPATVAVTGLATAPEPTTPTGPESVDLGATTTLQEVAFGTGPFTYQWYLNGNPIAGATNASYTIGNTPRSAAGIYTVEVSNSVGSAISQSSTLTVLASQLVNLSARAQVEPGQEVLVAGYSIAGQGAKQVLIRGIGPALAGYGVPGSLPDPLLQWYDSQGNLIASDAGWSATPTSGVTSGGLSALAPTAADYSAVGAFGLASGSLDSAMETNEPAGSTYTAQVSGASGDGGVALAELYDADPQSSTARLVNISARANVGGSSAVLIAGFTISGPVPETVLVRAVGPALSAYGVSAPLAQPVLTLYDSSSNVIATNSGWVNAPVAGSSTVQATFRAATAADFSSVGAFSLPANSADSALVVTLPPNAGYSVIESGADGTGGVGIVEVYELQ